MLTTNYNVFPTRPTRIGPTAVEWDVKVAELTLHLSRYRIHESAGHIAVIHRCGEILADLPEYVPREGMHETLRRCLARAIREDRMQGMANTLAAMYVSQSGPTLEWDSRMDVAKWYWPRHSLVHLDETGPPVGLELERRIYILCQNSVRTWEALKTYHLALEELPCVLEALDLGKATDVLFWLWARGGPPLPLADKMR